MHQASNPLLTPPLVSQAKIVEELTEQRQDRIKRVHVAQKDKDGLESAKLDAEALLCAFEITSQCGL